MVQTIIFRPLRATALVALASLAACGSLPGVSDGKAEVLIDREGLDIVAADAGRQLTFMKDRKSTERICMGPPPDFSRTAGSGISLGVPTPSGGAMGVGRNLSQGALDLGGRDPALLMARELLYRACELASNTNADAATERSIYERFLRAIIEIAKYQQGAGSIPQGAEPVPAPLPSAAAVPKKSKKRADTDSSKDGDD